MGVYFIDQYSLLHFASGIIAYFWNISLTTWIIMHVIFEYIENTKIGIYIINNWISFWPGGKPRADNFLNSFFGDNICAILGWLFAYGVDKIGNKYGLYDSHIK